MNQQLIEKAKNTEITFYEKIVSPKSVCRIVTGEQYYNGYGIEEIAPYSGRNVTQWEEMCFDFGEHFVGYLSFHLSSLDELSDSPVRLKFTFAEQPFEFSHTEDQKAGWLSYSWIQDEIINIDVVPCRVELPRRYAFRYVKIEILAKNKVMHLAFDDIRVRAVSSAGFAYQNTLEEKYAKIEEVSYRTLRDCMQSFYEDGPKRDRRLWLGDIRLQALVNYATVKDTALFKKCMYLFAGLTDEEGKVPACLYELPEPTNGKIFLRDYSLLFMAALWDYYEFSGDKEFCEELFEVAYDQYRSFYEIIGEDGTVMDQEGWWCFIDWDDDLPKPLAMTAIGAYCMNFARDMAAALGKEAESAEAEKYRLLLCEGARKRYFNAERGLFEENGIASWNPNCFMILSGGLSMEEGRQIMRTLKQDKEARLPVTPYVYHYVMESYGLLGMKEEMEDMLFDYWGEMIACGADTFWEAFKKGDSTFSPYDDVVLNSSCHAWSCTPVYLIKKYLV